MQTNSWVNLGRKLSSDEQDELITGIATMMEGPGDKFDRFRDHSKLRSKHNINYNKLYGLDQADNEWNVVLEYENTRHDSGRPLTYSATVVMSSETDPVDTLDYDVRRAKWETSNPPNRYHVTNFVTSDVKSNAKNMLQKMK